jgi:hypothetical protein
VFVFKIDKWDGELITQTDETVDARFFPLDELPEIAQYYIETLEDLKIFKKSGQLILK